MTLDERIAILESTVVELRRQLDAATTGRTSMARTHRCGVCGGGHLLHVRRMQEQAHSGIENMALQLEHGFVFNHQHGLLEAWVCRSCCFVEWYAVSLNDVDIDGHNVVAVDAPNEAPPVDGAYR
ncbi:MAG: hypothetical protein QM831_22265 [Kofleriaceae bacterium]